MAAAQLHPGAEPSPVSRQCVINGCDRRGTERRAFSLGRFDVIAMVCSSHAHLSTHPVHRRGTGHRRVQPQHDRRN